MSDADPTTRGPERIEVWLREAAELRAGLIPDGSLQRMGATLIAAKLREAADEIHRLTGRLINAENTLGVIAQDATDYPQRIANQYFEDVNHQ